MFRVFNPEVPVSAYQTFTLAQPVDTHTRAATCAEVDCAHYRNGWESRIDETTDLGREQAQYIRAASGRRFVELKRDDGLTTFVFGAEQPCFRQHRRSLEREPFYLVRGGDHRADLGLIREHVNGEDFVDDMGNQLISLADRRAQG